VNGKLSSNQKLRRVDEIFPGAGATITNLSRFSDWVTWGYDWHLDVEPTMREIAERNGRAWQSGSLVFFDKPIANTHRARLAGIAPQPRRIGASHAAGDRRPGGSGNGARAQCGTLTWCGHLRRYSHNSLF
jgi:hypothetical protein